MFSFVFLHPTAPAEHWCLKTQKKTTWDAAIAALVCHRLNRNMEMLFLAIQEEDEELIFVMLSTLHIPRGVTYDPLSPKFDLARLTEAQCLDKFRFESDDIRRLAALLHIPHRVEVANGSIEVLYLPLLRQQSQCPWLTEYLCFLFFSTARRKKTTIIVSL